jgi:hypothetical protein
MDDDGIEMIRHGKGDECPPGTHSYVPIIEGNETTGLVCTICGRTIREDMERSYLIVSEKGLIDTRQRPPSRKHPRF